MLWITAGGPEPIIPGWYPTISRWDRHSIYVAGAHRWMGSDWISIEPESLACYYREVFEHAHEARERARELEVGLGTLVAIGAVSGLQAEELNELDDQRGQGVIGWLGQATRRIWGGTIPPR